MLLQPLPLAAWLAGSQAGERQPSYPVRLAALQARLPRQQR